MCLLFAYGHSGGILGVGARALLGNGARGEGESRESSEEDEVTHVDGVWR